VAPARYRFSPVITIAHVLATTVVVLRFTYDPITSRRLANNLTGVRPHTRRRQPRRQQRHGEGERGTAAEFLVGEHDGVAVVQVSQAPGGEHQHGDVDEAGGAESDEDVEAYGPAVLRVCLGEGGVQVDHVRHDRGADDPDRQHQHAFAVAHGHGRFGGRVGGEEVVEEAEEDDPEQAGDGQLERPVTTAAQLKQSATTAVIRPATGRGTSKSNERPRAAPTNSARSVAVMLVAKLPGSMYATAATNAGPSMVTVRARGGSTTADTTTNPRERFEGKTCREWFCQFQLTKPLTTDSG